MFELDDRLETLRGASAEMALEMRGHALAIDARPQEMDPHLFLAAYEATRRGMTPLRFGDGPQRYGRYTYPPGSCLEQVVQTVELAHGDAGVLLACPGASLAGIIVEHLGDDAQQEHFYRALTDATWTFFAVTEPERGSDASMVQTALRRESPDLYRLSGTKRYIGSGARGAIGVVLARTGPGPLSLRAAIVHADAPGFHGESLDMIGLRGTCLAEIRLDDVPLPADLLLGRHLPPTRRGLWGAVRVFNHMRARVAALAVGTGLALVDLARAERPNAPGAARLAARLDACRALVYTAGAAVDRDPDAVRPSSTAKLAAVALARESARWAVNALSPAALADQPLLEKWTRDVGAFEFMEGTSDIQRQHLAKAYLKGLHQPSDSRTDSAANSRATEGAPPWTSA
jgi:alkylation response protein AidB-like acyl-CoA dehydrogenase